MKCDYFNCCYAQHQAYRLKYDSVKSKCIAILERISKNKWIPVDEYKDIAWLVASKYSGNASATYNSFNIENLGHFKNARCNVYSDDLNFSFSEKGKYTSYTPICFDRTGVISYPSITQKDELEKEHLSQMMFASSSKYREVNYCNCGKITKDSSHECKSCRMKLYWLHKKSEELRENRKLLDRLRSAIKEKINENI